ncbi:MAG: hypothetical protein CSA07_01225 [Bacteroidia bacterium]|nr:MAG: hypothetical protein CSA07_01225 [Bacteroidia bacterium]
MGRKHSRYERGFRPLAQLLASGLLILLGALPALAQGKSLSGRVLDGEGKPLPAVNVIVLETGQGTVCNDRGEFTLSLPNASPAKIRFSAVGYGTLDTTLSVGPADHRHTITLPLVDTEIGAVEVSTSVRTDATMERIFLPDQSAVATAGAGVESLLKTLPGVSSRNELSSQYSVRGGSFDENLVYIDGMQVHRPSLVRGGSQEGLSVINPDMVERLEFSAGAFPANLGDRMSSALTIGYRQPRGYRAKLDLSLLESRLLLEGGEKDGQWSGMVGLRYKSTRLLLNTQDTKGDYRPNFMDLQVKGTWAPRGDMQLELLSGYMRNEYQFRPTRKETTFGNLQSPYNQMTIFYEGGERDLYQTLFSNLRYRWRLGEQWTLRAQLSGFGTMEAESFDILGEYWLSSIKPSDQPNPLNDSLANKGIGGAFDHARNRLQALVLRGGLSTRYQHHGGTYELGLELEQKRLEQDLNEWHLVDSAEYTLPLEPLAFSPTDRVRNRGELNASKSALYLTARHQWELAGLELELAGGGRLTSRDWKHAIRFSPRGSITVRPLSYPTLSAYFASGFYYQYPFYRELQDRHGELHPKLRPQRSVHYVLGTRLNFPQFDIPFQVQVELYRKDFRHYIPYMVDNLRLRYEAENAARGDIMGIDLKVNATLVPGAESWLSLSLMRGQLRLDQPLRRAEAMPREDGYFPLPTDQRLAISVFLQDYLPWWPSFHVHVATTYATGLPFTPPDGRYGLTGRLPAYQRVDIGFTKIFRSDHHSDQWLSGVKWLRDWSVTAEVLNLTDFANTASYLWVSIPGGEGLSKLAVPNYLTARCINFRLVVGF